MKCEARSPAVPACASLFLLAFLLTFLLTFLLVPCADATTLRIEAESFYYFGQITGCGYNVVVQPCTGASGGYGVDGIDCEGEWIKIHLSLTSAFRFYTALRSAGGLGFVRNFRIDYCRDETGEPLVASLLLDTPPGLGVS
jgi:hypothetical protein